MSVELSFAGDRSKRHALGVPGAYYYRPYACISLPANHHRQKVSSNHSLSCGASFRKSHRAETIHRRKHDGHLLNHRGHTNSYAVHKQAKAAPVYSKKTATLGPSSLPAYDLSSDLARYHFFHSPKPQTDTPYISPDGSDARRDSPLEADRGSELRSWSQTYAAFDYWCFYRIEMLKYQLQVMLSRGDACHSVDRSI